MHTTSTNLVFPLGHTQRKLFRNKIEERRIVRRLIDSYGIVGIPDKPVAALSGGNQQKVLMASRLGGSYRVLVVEEPTRGIDIGAREVIHDILREIGEKGVAVLVISSDVDEIVELVDRALVFSHGRLTAELRGDEMTVDQLLLKADARLNVDEANKG
jgi:ABC-type sugar transport system ATPase subunit